jgi:hypothetical protein
MNDISVGEGEAGRTTTIPPGETVPVEATTVIRTQTLDEWWVSHLQNDQVTELRMRMYLTVDLSAAGGGEQRVPLDEFTRTIETDVFGTKDAAAADANADDGSDGGTNGSDGSDGGDSTAVGTDTPTGTAASGSGADDATATPTDAPTATPTPTATPGGTTTTDDGLF